MIELHARTRRISGSRLEELLGRYDARSVVDPLMGLPTHLNYLKRHGIAVHGGDVLEWFVRAGEGLVVNDFTILRDIEVAEIVEMLPGRIYPLDRFKAWEGVFFTEEQCAYLGVWHDNVRNLRSDGQTVMLLAIDGKAAGLIGVADPVKASTAEAIRLLHAENVQIIMLTGDNRVTAEAVAKKLGIDRIEAEVLPEQKSAIVKQLQTQGRIVAMAGDGINDAPALAQAQVGIAMGSGTDVAMESAGITLIKGDLRGIVRALRLSRTTMRNIRQNLFFAFIYNVIGIPVAAGVLYPFFGLLLSPIIAAAAMSFSSVSVITNALRLRRVKL